MTERQVFLHEWVDPENAVRQLERWTKAFDVRAVMLEKVNSTPNDGHVGAFRFGINYGQWQGLLSGLKVPFEMVAPVTWHARLVRKEIAGTPKERSIRTVQLLFPGLTEKDRVFEKTSQPGRHDHAGILRQAVRRKE